MLKIIDNVDLKELEKFKIKPHYVVNEHTGETSIDYLYSSKYVSKHGYLRISPIKTSAAYKVLHIFNRKIRNMECGLYLNEDNFIDIDLLYDLIKADLVEKVSDDDEN